MFKKTLFVTLALVLVLTACAPAATATPEAAAPTQVPATSVPATAVPPTEEPTQEPVTLQVWIYDSFTPDDKAPIYDAVKKFEEKYPYITVELIPTPSGSGPYRDAYIAAAQGGGGPDAAMVDIIWTPQLAAAELAMNLDTFASEDIKNYYPGPVETVTYDNSIYGIPWYTNALAMFYNKTAFEKAGLPLPADGWTWDDFDKAAKALTKDNMYGFGLMAGYGGSYEWFSWLWQNGGEILTADNTKAAFTSPAGIESAKYFLGLITDKKVVPEAAKSWKSWDELNTAFTSQTIAMYMVGDWGIKPVTSANPSFEWGVAPLPMNKTRATVVGGANWIINPNTKNADAAYKWVQYITGPDVFSLMDGYSRIAARTGGEQQIGKDNPKLQVMIDSLAYSRARPSIPNWTSVDYDCIQPAFLEVILNGKSVDEALQDAAACTDKTLAQ